MSSTTSQPSETTTVRAVTTIFTPPSSCIERTYTISRLGEDFTDTRSNTLTIYRAYSSECFPSEASPSAGYVFLSPGICPSAYSIASMWTDKNIGYTATFATCCPWYMHASDAYYDCGSSPEMMSVAMFNPENVQTPITSSGYAFDTPIVIAWQETDLSNFERHPTETGRFNVATGIPPPLAVNGSVIEVSALPSFPAEAAGLSTGAKAGIGVGVAVGVLLITSLVVLVFWRRRRAERAAEAEGRTSVSEERPEMPDDSKNLALEVSNDGQLFEAQEKEKPHEADDGNMRLEMEGDVLVQAPRYSFEADRKDMVDYYAGGSPAELEGDGIKPDRDMKLRS